MIRSYASYLQASEFIRHFLTLMSGTGIAAIIAVATTPILTRIYTPEEFGLFALILTFISVLSTISCLRYEIAIVLPKYNYQAAQLASISFFLSCANALLLWIFFLIFAHDIAIALNKDIANYLYLVPLAIFLNGTYSIMNYYSNRQKKYKNLSISKVLNESSSSFAKIGLGAAHTGVWGLIVGQIIGKIVSSINLWRITFESIWRHRRCFSYSMLKKVALQNKEYPLYSSPAAIIGALSINLHIILFSHYYGNEVVGYISLATQIMMGPLLIIGHSFSQVFYQKISILNDFNSISKTYFRSFIYLLPLCILILCLSFFVPNNIYIIILGDNWPNLKKYLIILSFLASGQLLGSSLSMIYVRFKKNDLLLIFSLVNAAITISIITLGHFFDLDFFSTLTIYSISKSFLYISLGIYGIYLIKNHFRI